MTTFTLPHELLGDGAHKVSAVHGWFADRSAFGPVRDDLDDRRAIIDLTTGGSRAHGTGATGGAV